MKTPTKKMSQERTKRRDFARLIMNTLNKAKVPGLVFGVAERYGDVTILALGSEKVFSLRVEREEGDMRLELPGIVQTTKA